MSKITVILPVYNGEKYIRKAVESVLNQTLNDFELIIVNDGSSDNTLDIITSYSDNRIRIINQSNHGPGASRNSALDIAQGEYIMFLDSDDWFSEDAFEIAYNHISKFKSDLAFFQMINYDNGRIYENDWFNLSSFDESFENKVFSPQEIYFSIFDLSVGVCQKIYNYKFLKKINAYFPEGFILKICLSFFMFY